MDLSDGEVNFSLLRPDEGRVDITPWSRGNLGPNHVGVEIEDTAGVVERLKEFGIEIYGEDKEQWPPRFFKFLDPDGIEIDVATPDRSWKF